MKKLFLLLCSLQTVAIAAESSSHKARIDQLTQELEDAAAAKDQPRIRRIAQELKRESDAAAREMQSKTDEHGKRPDVQVFRQQAKDVAAGIQRTTETLEYRITKAAGKGDIAEVRSLRGQGADLNAGGPMLAPPLMSAARRGDVPMATYLIAEGAKIVVGEGAGAHNALMTAVDVSPNKDNSAMIRFLISKGADINLRLDTLGSTMTAPGRRRSGKPLDPRAEAYLRERSEKMKSDTVLMAALRKNHMAHLRTLLSLHADPNLYGNGSTPLMVARRQNNAEAVRLLTAAGAH